MRWLIIALLVSIGGLLLAAAGMALHVLQHRKKPKRESPHRDQAVLEAPEESDLESES